MRIAALEILVARRGPAVRYVERARLDAAAVRGALAVADDATWWRAVHQTIDDGEQAALELARDARFTPNECSAAVAAVDAYAVLRKRLQDLRAEGIKGSLNQESSSPRRSPSTAKAGNTGR